VNAVIVSTCWIRARSLCWCGWGRLCVLSPAVVARQRGQTALHHALDGSNLAAVECLVELGADLNAKDEVRCQPYTSATICYGSNKMTKFPCWLVQQGNDAAHYAERWGNAAVREYLAKQLQRAVKPNAAPSSRQQRGTARQRRAEVDHPPKSHKARKSSDPELLNAARCCPRFHRVRSWRMRRARQVIQPVCDLRVHAV
jgi:hypothetical protein